MIGEDFMFGDKWLSEFGMIMCSPEEAQAFVSRSLDRAEITSTRAKPNHYTTRYEDSLNLNFLILKEDGICSNQENLKLTGDEIHFLRAWLESPKKPTELVVPLSDDEMNVHYYGVFSSVQPYDEEGNCYGLNLTFTCDAPYGYSDENIMRVKINGSASPVSGRIFNNSAEREEKLKPKITIFSADTFGSGEEITITNISDDNNSMHLEIPEGLEKLVIDCQKKIITDEDGNLISMDDIGVNVPVGGAYNFISTDMYLFYWLSLVPDLNQLTFTPSEQNTIKNIDISTRYIIKSGGF